MSIPVRVVGGTIGGEYKEWAISGEGAALTSQLPYPPMLITKTIPFRQNLTNDGMPSDGSNEDMKVVGTLTAPIDFWIPAHSKNDRYITYLSFVLAGSAAKLSDFAAASALSNGCKLFYRHTLAGEIVIHDSLTTNFSFMRLALGQPSFGTAGDAFRGKNVVGAVDAYIPTMDLRMFSPDGYGIKLDAGTTQRLTLQIRDDLTVAGVTAFDCVAYGFDRIP